MKASKHLAAALVTAASALVGIAPLAGGVAAHARAALVPPGWRIYTDPAGDAGAADITKVTVSGDPASGLIRLAVAARGLSAIDRALEPDITVWVDSDRNRSTGSASGCEYGLKFWLSPSGVTSHVLRWDDVGGKWEAVPPSPTASVTRSGDTLTWSFSTADVGNATGFQFWLSSAVYAGRHIAAEDVAAFDTRWTYDLSTTPVTFRDQAHDAAAPDITTIAMRNERTTGVTTLSATARGMFAIRRTLKPDLDVCLDTDRDESTGLSGCDYRLRFAVRPGGTTWRIDRWNTRTQAWHARPKSATTAFSRRGDVLTWRFARADIGNPMRLEFSLVSAIYPGGQIIEDVAPEYGRWAFDVPPAASHAPRPR